MTVNNFQIDEEVEATSQTDGTTHHRTVQLAPWCLQGLPLPCNGILAPWIAEKIERRFCSLVVMTGYPVGGSYAIGSVIVGSKAVDGCGERRSFWITDEGDRAV